MDFLFNVDGADFDEISPGEVLDEVPWSCCALSKAFLTELRIANVESDSL